MNFKDMTNAKLREVCKEKGLAIHGNKSQLIERLNASAMATLTAKPDMDAIAEKFGVVPKVEVEYIAEAVKAEPKVVEAKPVLDTSKQDIMNKVNNFFAGRATCVFKQDGSPAGNFIFTGGPHKEWCVTAGQTEASVMHYAKSFVAQVRVAKKIPGSDNVYVQ